MVRDMILESGSAVAEAAWMRDYMIDYAKDYGTRWYRSKGQNDLSDPSSPFCSYLMNKKWTMEEEFTKHMLHFQQVTLSSNHFSKLHSDIPGRTDSH